MTAMKQSDLGLHLTTKRTRKREFLAQMERVVPWGALVDATLISAPSSTKNNSGGGDPGMVSGEGAQPAARTRA